MNGISIIIPTLNEEKYVGKLLECLCKQTYKNFEVIVVDGNSDDKTKDVINSYKRKLDLRLINHKRGIAAQRNFGADKAHFQWLLFLDADVSFNNLFLFESIKTINRKKGNIAIPLYVSNSKRFTYRLPLFLLNVWFNITYKLYGTGCGAAIFIKKRIHDKVGGFKECINWANDIIYLRKSGLTGNLITLRTKVFFSVRRFKCEGTRKTLYKWILAYFQILFKKDKLTNNISYNYGCYKPESCSKK
jgi:glycosyltransferase involved in cell wall biosynthesis